jgi:hypothetical protein
MSTLGYVLRIPSLIYSNTGVTRLYPTAGSKKQLVKSAYPTFVKALARLDELTDEAALGSGSIRFEKTSVDEFDGVCIETNRESSVDKTKCRCSERGGVSWVPIAWRGELRMAFKSATDSSSTRISLGKGDGSVPFFGMSRMSHIMS